LKDKKGGILPRWLAISIPLAFIVAGLSVSFLAYRTLEARLSQPLNPLAEAAEAVSEIDLQPLGQVGQVEVPTLLPGEVLPPPIPTSESEQDAERTTVLIMGIDRRPGEPFISRTDTMILFSVDHVDRTASMLSIPRDLYTVLPGRGRERINTAFVYGSVGNNPAGGATLAMQTIEYNLGVKVDHYVLVDFGAVIDGIDSVGGISVDVPFTINDPYYPDHDYGYDPLFIPAGLQDLDGELALKYARTRHQDNDFGRSRRQQQVILALRERVLSLGLTDLLLRAPFLYDKLSSGVRTDLSLDQIVSLARVVSDVNSEDIRSDVLDHRYVTSFRTDQGAEVLVLINERASALIEELFFQ